MAAAKKVFTPENSTSILNAINLKDPKGDHVLDAFKDLSTAIDKATGNVTEKAKEALGNVACKYTVINGKVLDGLANTAAVLGNFVVVGYQIVASGEMSDDDQKMLTDMGSKVNGQFVDDLAKYSTDSSNDLMTVYNVLLMESGGAELENHLDCRKKKETEMSEQAKVLVEKLTTLGTIKGEIASYEYEIKLSEAGIKDAKAAKMAAEEEFRTLKAQLPSYEAEVQKHRDTSVKESGSFFVFSWTARDIHIDNGERVAREQLVALNNRIDSLSKRLDNWPTTTNFETILKDANVKIKVPQEKLKAAEDEVKAAQDACNKLKEDYDGIMKEIQEEYNKCGSMNIECLKQVDAIAVAINDGSEALQKAFENIKGNMKAIDASKYLLVKSIEESLNVLRISDQYTDAGTIRLIKTSLGIAD